MECIQKWTAERGHRIEPYGLDISPELADLSRTRLPHWAGRIYTGNVLTWPPTRRFDFVRTGMEYVPSRRRRDLVHRLLDEFLNDDGRLIIGGYSAEVGEPDSLEQDLAAWGFTVSAAPPVPTTTNASPNASSGSTSDYWLTGSAQFTSPAGDAAASRRWET